MKQQRLLPERMRCLSRPARGEWIEIVLSLALVSFSRLAPHGASGLKKLSEEVSLKPFQSHFARSEWIEAINRLALTESLNVSPHAG